MIALATVSSMAFAAPGFAQTDMSMGHNMLTGALYNYFSANGLPTESIGDLTIGQIAQIKDVIDGDENEGNKKNRIMAITDQ